MKVNMRLLPVKAHWFFFMAASGPILPFLTVYGKQLGISEVVMGSISAVMPLGFLIAKPIFGFLLDYFHRQRKILFILLICSMSTFYVLLYFVPPLTPNVNPDLSGNASMSYDGIYNGSLEMENMSRLDNTTAPSEDLYHSVTFYSFICLMCLAMISYNVANSISDAVCFDMLGEGQESEYGKQRVWGAIGFGVTALLGGLGMDYWSQGEVKNYAAAFILVIAFTFIDFICCTKLKLPKLGQSKQILKDVRWVLQKTRVVIFLGFTALAGILDSFIIYFMFWYLEDLSKEHDQMSSVKTLEGLIVAAQTLGGEVIFFPLSGKILQRLGHGHTFTICFFTYALRLGLISLVPSPRWLLPIELCMQGPTFALCYTTIVAYASAEAPPGTSATMQGLVAGIDDGLGYAIGSLVGGFLYRAVGGQRAFQIFSGCALICGFSHALVFKYITSKKKQPDSSLDNGVVYMPPMIALKNVETPGATEANGKNGHNHP